MKDIGKSADKNTSWLGGIIDGEGTIAMNKANHKDGHVSYHPEIIITNMDILIINNVRDAIKEFAGCFLFKKQTKNGICFQVGVNGMKRCKTLLQAILPYLHGIKLYRAQVLIAWINYRFSLPSHSKQDAIDVEVNNMFRSINLRDYMLNSKEQNLDEEIVRSSQKCEELVRNVQVLLNQVEQQ